MEMGYAAIGEAPGRDDLRCGHFGLARLSRRLSPVLPGPYLAPNDGEVEHVGVSFILQNGDHLQVLIAPPQLETLYRHISSARNQLRARMPRGRERT